MTPTQQAELIDALRREIVLAICGADDLKCGYPVCGCRVTPRRADAALAIFERFLAAAPPAWRDIAEAPDGKAVLACSSGVRLMRFDAKIGQWRNMLGRPKPAPTAWMPLPPPPEGRGHA